MDDKPHTQNLTIRHNPALFFIKYITPRFILNHYG